MVGVQTTVEGLPLAGTAHKLRGLLGDVGCFADLRPFVPPGCSEQVVMRKHDGYFH
jgi:hypothetical protein